MSVYSKQLDCALIPIAKHVYYREDNPNILAKAFRNAKNMQSEQLLQQEAYAIVPCPKILGRVWENDVGYLLMERIQGKTVHELYGPHDYDIPSSVWTQIHSIVSRLYYRDIHYIDITPYNFIVQNETNKVFVIDFGHAYKQRVNWFLKEFLDGENTWNSDFE